MLIFHFIFLIFTLQFVSCSQVNTESKDHFNSKEKFRHGIVPVTKENNFKAKDLRVYSADSIERGKVLYKSKCLKCHGENGKGSASAAGLRGVKVTDLSQLAKNVPDFRFFMTFSKWKGNMPGWENVLSKKELRDLEAYITELSRP